MFLFHQITDAANSQESEKFTSQEVSNCLSRMMDDNQVMVSDNIVFLI